MKKILSILFVMILFVVAIPVTTAFADGENTGETPTATPYNVYSGEVDPTEEGYVGNNGDIYIQTLETGYVVFRMVNQEWTKLGTLYFTKFVEGEQETKKDWTSYLLLGGIVIVLILMLYLPRRRQRKAQEETKAKLQIGSVVTTTSGIIGTIIDLDDQSFTIETGEGDSKSTMRYVIQAIYQIHPTKADAEKEAEGETTNEIK